MNIRFVKSSDYDVISPQINDWWGGREMTDFLPKLFFVHFSNTSFIAEKDGEIVGFLIGFLSQTNPDVAYIHFAGVHPEHRHNNIGSRLYQEFYQIVKKDNRKTVHAITSPMNVVSIDYHKQMGFEVKKGDKIVNGISVFYADNEDESQDRVLFVKKLD